MVVLSLGPVFYSQVNISVPAPEREYFQEQWRNHARLQVISVSMVSLLSRTQERNLHTDLVLVSEDGRSFHVHRAGSLFSKFLGTLFLGIRS